MTFAKVSYILRECGLELGTDIIPLDVVRLHELRLLSSQSRRVHVYIVQKVEKDAQLLNGYKQKTKIFAVAHHTELHQYGHEL